MRRNAVGRQVDEATPWLRRRINLQARNFIGNVFSVLLTGFAVPWVANRLGWWINPRGDRLRTNLAGAVLIVAIYALSIGIFWRYF